MANYACEVNGVAKKYLGYIEKASNSNLDSFTGNKGTNNYTRFSRDVNAVGLIPAAVSITAVDWKVVVGSAALAGIVSVLTSVAGIPECKSE